MRYNAIDDPLCYPGTHILRNIEGIEDQAELDEFEQLMFDSRSEEELPEGNLDFAHFCALHHHFFQDVYEWAGQPRTIRTGKGENWFCYPEYIVSQATKLFAELARHNYFLDVADKAEFAKAAAWFLSELNAIHVFREGNGRIQLVFLTLLARHADFELDEDQLRPEAFLSAMIASFDGELDALESEIQRLL
ncbi:Fic/DOC family protein [Agrobacterium larrymoorei]|uniref:protein adenylyltransferase n=1 Tax=Agrobacterium larrymoorei TaxID=160699 RepID=A0AAF0H883_9HYPH|nr:Fic family protein [Agrobacterium larrymoorei]WHA39738.1 Fic family protein [Agrobacterium larrymoorei]